MGNKVGKVGKIVVVGLVLIALSQSVGALGLAVSPASVEINDALKGGEYVRTITIFNSGEEAYNCSLGCVGEVQGWVLFYTEDNLTTPISEIAVPSKDKNVCIAKFKIPGEVASGNYTSKIYVETVPTGGIEGSGQAVKLRMSTDVMVNVTSKQILSGTVKSITTTDTEVNLPLTVRVEFQNTGNVVATPEIAVKITKNGTVTDEFTHSETGVKVNTKDIIPVEWGTTGKESGDYTANVTVSLGGERLSTKELQFQLLPVGTLSRQGSLTDLSYEGDTSVGKTLKVLATFRNTGEIDAKAKLIGEVYVNGNLIDTISSEELLVPVREAGTLTAYLKIEEDGNYTIKGHVVYEGKMTATKELSFDVKTLSEEPEPTQTPKTSTPGFGAIGAAIAIASVMGYRIYRRRKLK